MSDILCRWLNNELRLSKTVEPNTFSKDFSTGYLIGEVLFKYQLQDDFSAFIKSNISSSKEGNFSRIEPTLQLLGVPFDQNTAQALMQEKQGAATRLLYQLYVLLQHRKMKRTPMDTVLPTAGGPHLHKKENDRVGPVGKRDAEVTLHKLSQRYEEQGRQLKEKSEMAELLQEQKKLLDTEDMRLKDMEKTMNPLYISSGKTLTGSRKAIGQNAPGEGGPELVLQSNSQYVQKIRQRLAEDSASCQQREKRRTRFLQEQLKAQENQQDAQRDEQLVRRLTRQTEQERRLVAQLLQVRAQKEVLRENRLFREQQYQEQRERDFLEALEREATLAQQAQLDEADEVSRQMELHNRMAAERAQHRHKKHSNLCWEVLDQIEDLATKVGEYRLLTGKLIPVKMMREWKELLLLGLPLYDPVPGDSDPGPLSAPLDPVERQKEELLNNQDYQEYTNMEGEWAWPEEAGEAKRHLGSNNILDHVVLRLKNMVNEPRPATPPPLFPQFTLKACVLGQPCSGKTTCLAQLAQAHGIHIISPDTLIQEALAAYQSGEKVSPSERAQRGAVIDQVLRTGKAIPDELLVNIIVETIRLVPDTSGWVLDGFPVNVAQARMLELALGGSTSVPIEKKPPRRGSNKQKAPQALEPIAAKKLPVLDLVLLLDTPESVLLNRAVRQSRRSCYTPSLDGCTDRGLGGRQIQHGIASFQDNWSKLEKWYSGNQGILVRLDANVSEEELFSSLESVLLQAVMNKPKGNALSYICLMTISESYARNIKAVMQNLRIERNIIIRHLFNIREEYKHYLSRPELNQEFVSQWQQDFNSSIPEDMRADTETKTELHQRLDDLRERLWDMSDKRREEDSQEKNSLVENGWLEDHKAFLINHFATLIQVSLMTKFIISHSQQQVVSFYYKVQSITQVTEVVSLLTLESGLVDWRRFLLSAALPWPLPSLAQLLLLLQGFRTADPGATGSVDRDQYLQVELWFPSETAEPVPEDPTDPLPYNRLANLRKLFFQMFADHSSSPPRLDYARMLGYLAAHPEPGQGVVRALSLALGRTLRHPAACRYVKVGPGAEPEGEEAEEEVVPRGSSGCDGVEQGVSVNALLAVLCHRDVHKSDLQRVFGELGYGPQEHVPFSVLCQHPVVQELMEGSNRYQLIDIHGVLKGQESESEPQLSPAS
uniref:Calponin-homology (CH) domain-containing protein n=1 Tax=Gadus morhua TaxID=8049 RepID=A0A8C4Z9L6_GADMO